MSIADFDKILRALKENIEAGDVKASFEKIIEITTVAQMMNKKELEFMHTGIRWKIGLEVQYGKN